MDDPIAWIETNGGTLHTDAEELREKIRAGKLRVKYGIDPTGTEVHLGHTVPLRKLQHFQREGHQVVLILGLATARVGDPSGRQKARQPLTAWDVASNAENYLTQIGKVIDVRRCEVRRNDEWFGGWTFDRVVNLMTQVTAQQILHRNDFSERLSAGRAIGFQEMFYPLMQAWDSVEVRADVEVGGTEQLFTMMLARQFQKAAGQSPQAVVTTPILRGTDGTRRMGKSLNNFISVREEPLQMFSKVMSIPDGVMPEWFTLLTDFDGDPLGHIQARPMDAKIGLAKKVVRGFYGEDVEKSCYEMWRSMFTGRSDPPVIPEAHVPYSKIGDDGTMLVCDLMVACGLAMTKSGARRAIYPVSGVTTGVERIKITDPDMKIHVENGLILRIGNRRVVKVKIDV